jgi:hypothetical protein
MEESPAEEKSPSKESAGEELIAPSLKQRQEKVPQLQFQSEEEDEYAPGNLFFDFNEEDDDY